MGPGDLPIGRRRLLKAAVGSLLGVHIDYMVTIDLLGFKRLVDTLGGVDITVTRGVYDSFYFDETRCRPASTSSLASTTWTATALAYARSRFGIRDDDFTRAARQQELLEALVRKMSRPPTSSSTCPSSEPRERYGRQ